MSGHVFVGIWIWLWCLLEWFIHCSALGRWTMTRINGQETLKDTAADKIILKQECLLHSAEYYILNSDWQTMINNKKKQHFWMVWTKSLRNWKSQHLLLNWAKWSICRFPITTGHGLKKKKKRKKETELNTATRPGAALGNHIHTCLHTIYHNQSSNHRGYK